MAVVVFTSQHAPEAEIVAGLLRSNGFHVRVLGSDTARMVGMGSHLAPTKVTVEPHEEEEARVLLGNVVRYDEHGRLSFVEPNEAEGRLGEPAAKTEEPKNCPNCGADWEPGFEVCWKCEYVLP